MKIGHLCFIFISALFMAFSCVHKPVVLVSTESASWETKAMVKQVRSGQINNVSIDVMAVKATKMRLEVSATLGYKVASIVLDKDHLQALIPPEKKFYDGQVTQEALVKVLKLPVHPFILYAMIFDQGLRGPGWVCHNDESGQIKECAFKDSATITWERLIPPQKIVHLKTKSVEMDWFFKTQDPEWVPKPEIFNLKVPDSYQTVRL